MRKKLPFTKSAIFKRAQEHIFSTGLNDGASRLSLLNMTYGLAKMHYVQDKFGFSPDATFATTPDETVSRNAARWEQGVSYGGKISWGSGNDKFLFLDVMPNCCGMIVGGLSRIPDPKEILKRVSDLENDSTYISDVKVKWDFYKGNHFIDVFRIEKKDAGIKLPKYAALIHAGCPELKEETEKYMGLYWSKSRQLMQMCRTVKTPFGNAYVLEGSNALDYYSFFLFAERFAKKRREIAFRRLFGQGDLLCNHTHQGLLNMNEMVLGCQNFQSTKELFPISIRADLPSYLVRGDRNFTPHQMDLLGFTARADDLGVYSRLQRSDIIPHGGGYSLPDSLGVSSVFELAGKRYFSIEMTDGIGKNIISNVRELEFGYRGAEVMQRTLDIGMCEVAAVLNPVYTIKI